MISSQTPLYLINNIRGSLLYFEENWIPERFAALGMEAHTGGLRGVMRSMMLTVTQYVRPGATLLRGTLCNPSVSTSN